MVNLPKSEDIFDILDKNHAFKVVNEVEKIVLSLDESNKAKGMTFFRKILSEESLSPKNLASIFSAACIAKPYCIEFYVDFMIDFSKSFEETNEKLSLLISFKRIFFLKFVRSRAPEICFLAVYLIKKGIIEENEIIGQRVASSLTFAHKMNNFQLEEETKDHLFPHFEEEMDKLRENDWELHIKLINKGKNPEKLVGIIKDDDVDTLQQFVSQENFDINQKISRSIYERSSIINSENSLIEISAFFGSIKCFKFLMLNHADMRLSLPKYAVCGGNVEIIRICEQKKLSFSGTSYMAVKYHQQSIFEWIFQSHSNFIRSEQKYLLENTTKYWNSDAMAYILCNGFPPNKLFIEACNHGNECYMSIIYNSFGQYLNVNELNRENLSPLHLACFSQSVEIVSILLGNKFINPDIKSTYCNEVLNIYISIKTNLIFKKNILIGVYFQNFIKSNSVTCCMLKRKC